MAELRISTLEDRLRLDYLRNKKNEKKNGQTLRDLWDTIKYTNIHIIGVPEGEGGETESIFEGIMAEHVLNLLKQNNIDLQHPRSSTESRINSEGFTPRHMIVKLLKDENKENLECSKSKGAHHRHGLLNKINS